MIMKNQSISPKTIENSEFLPPFEMLFREITNLDISNFNKECAKSSLRYSAYSSFKHFYGITLAMNFQNFQDRPRNINGVFTEAFPQPHCLFFFLLEQTTDRQIDLISHCTGLELLPVPPQNQICYSLHIQTIRISPGHQ